MAHSKNWWSRCVLNRVGRPHKEWADDIIDWWWGSLQELKYTAQDRTKWNVQRAQTSAKTSNRNQKWSGIRISISGLIRIRIRMSAGSLPKCCGFITVSYFVECRKNRPVTVWKMPINLLKCPIPQLWRKWKVIRNPYSGPDHRQKLTSSSDC